MGKFLRNMLIGVGIGLLFAPMPGQDMRRLISERVRSLIGSFPSNNGGGSGTSSNASRNTGSASSVGSGSSMGINTSTAARTEQQIPGGSQSALSATAPASTTGSPTEQGLKNIAESAMHDTGAEETLVAEPFQPAYPEYVNPERNPATPSAPNPTPAPAPSPRSTPNPNPRSNPNSRTNPNPRPKS